jgi:hypothetical protein
MASFDPSNEVPAVATPVSLDEARALLFAVAPSSWAGNVLVYLLALLWVECGRGARVIAHNFGNLAAGGYAKNKAGEWVDVAWWTGSYWRPDWYASPPEERWQSLHERMLRGEAPSAFRAYPGPTDGVRAFVRLLSDPRFAGVLTAAREDSPEAFVQALHDSGYSKDYKAAHVPTFRALVAEIRAKAPGLAPEPKAVETGSGLLLGAAAAAAGLVVARGATSHGKQTKRAGTRRR